MEQSKVLDQNKIWYWWMGELAYGWEQTAGVERADLENRLAQRSKAELINLISHMIAYYPDLEALLESPLTSKSEPESSPQAKAIQRQVRHVFYRVVGQRNASYALTLALLDLVELGDKHIAQQNCREAVIVYEAVIREVLDNYDLVEDPDGELLQVIHRANDGLSKCLANSTDPLFRQTILRTLFDSYLWDVECGGTDLGLETLDLIHCHITATERQTMIQWVEAVLPPGSSWRDNFRRQMYSEGLARLQARR